MQQFNPPQIIKQYDINLNGLQGNHHRAALIYEDILPDKISLGNQTSLGERISLYEFLLILRLLLAENTLKQLRLLLSSVILYTLFVRLRRVISTQLLMCTFKNKLLATCNNYTFI